VRPPLAAELRSLAGGALVLLYQEPVKFFLQNSTVSEGLDEAAIQGF